MKWYYTIILLVIFVLGKYFQAKASIFLKEEYKKTWPNRNMKYPISYFSEAYFDKKGVLFKNLMIFIPFFGFILLVILILVD
ncbi:MAG: hypothetical protein IH620_05320 [Ignavibacterium sp.]|nr:hypothetical protein [Ignavibacterium sp.]